jgi:hypothetical protein
MDLISSIFFLVFVVLGFATFFYEAVTAIMRRLQYRDPVPVGGDRPPQVEANLQREEEAIREIRHRRREEREQAIRHQLQRQFDIFNAGMGNNVSGGRRLGHPRGPPPPPALSAAELERRRVLQEQNAEFERAQAADRERLRQEQLEQQQLLEEQRRAAEEQRAIQARLEEERRRKEEIYQQRIARFRDLPPEPQDNQGPSSSAAELVELAIRLPNGTRLNRRFAAHNTLADVKCYIEGSCPDLALDYRILCAALSKTPLGPPDATLALLGLSPRALLFVDEPE